MIILWPLTGAIIVWEQQWLIEYVFHLKGSKCYRENISLLHLYDLCLIVIVTIVGREVCRSHKTCQ